MHTFKKVPLTLKMMLFTFAVGIVTWALLDPMHSRSMKSVFGEQLNERLQQEAHENRILFDEYVDRFIQSTKILVSQLGLRDYVSAHDREWASVHPRKDRIIYHNTPPAWLPKSSIIRTLPDMHYVFLLDKGRSVREVYMRYPELPPPALIEPAVLLLQLSHQQSFMTELDNMPYLIASESLSDDQGNMSATLLAAGPLDNKFLLESQGSVYSHKLVTLVGRDPSVIIASSHPETLAPGTEIESLKDRYLFTGSHFFDYGSSNLQIQFMTFLPKKPYELLSESIMNEERQGRMVTALMLILSFSLLMFWVTKRVRNVTARLGDFAELKLKMKQPQVQEGDEIEVLEQQLRALSAEVIKSHESIHEQARLLMQERDRAQNYLDIAASILLVLDADHKIVLINRKGCEILGYTEKELTGRDWFDTVLPAGLREEARAYFQDLIADNVHHDIYVESSLWTRNGDKRHIGWYIALLKNESGIITGLLGSGADVTDRIKAEEELWKAHQMLEERVRQRTAELEEKNILLKTEIHERKSAEKNLQIEKDKLHKYLDISAVMVVMIDRNQNVTLINKKGCEILGYREDEIIGRNWFDTFLPERLRDDVKTVHARILAGAIEPAEYYENYVLTNSGEEKMIAWYNTVFRDEAGQITATLGTGVDITEQKKIENALKLSEERFRGAFEAAAIGICLASPEGRWLQVNEALCNITGYSEQEMLSLRFQDLTHPEDLDADLGYVRQLLAGEIRNFNMEKRYIHKDGHVVWIFLSVSLVRDENSIPLYFVGQIQDISSRKQAEMQIASSLKEKDVLLQEIHHRVKNNMTVISSLLKLQADKVKDDYYRELFNESINRIKAMALIHETLYRSEDLARIVFSDYLRDTIDNLMAFYSVNARSIRLHKKLERITLPLDTSIPCGLIVNELLTNALKHAFPEGRSGEILVSLKKMKNNEVELTVSDNGVGLPADLDSRTSSSLGLNIVNALVRQIKGTITLNKARGTEFLITFNIDA